ncbi:unnamed protein product [Lymnaea stagnalis]|uniref:Uncharacterized protein n=1 Tax=Lymnaea stagnalis TaxID=6523 RepID=A0AAV2I3K5_LYMST
MNSSATSMAALIATSGYLFVFLLIQGALSQSVWLHSWATQSISGCVRGLISEKDNYIVKATVNATAPVLSNLVDFQIMWTNETEFKSICTLDIITCAMPSSKLCYCASKVGTIYEVVLNRTVSAVESKAYIRLRWANTSGSNAVESNVLRLPDIYDLNSVSSVLTIDGRNTACPVNVTHSSVFKFRCQNSPSPCRLTITLDNAKSMSGDDVITYNVPTNVLATTSHVLTFTYSVCGRPATSFECQISIDPSSSSPYCKESCLALFVIFNIITIGAIGVGIATLCLLNKNSICLLKNIIDFMNKHKLLCISFGLLAILDIVLLIVGAAEYPYLSLEGPGTELNVWKVMLIIFCVANFALIFLAVMLVIIKRTIRTGG